MKICMLFTIFLPLAERSLPRRSKAVLPFYIITVRPSKSSVSELRRRNGKRTEKRGGEEAPLKLSSEKSEEGKNDAKKAYLVLQGWIGEGQQQPGRL